ncbi:MAG: hypothetical protein MJZ68_01175 [archaeon]|nr:hypothetical protein [archaeon]
MSNGTAEIPSQIVSANVVDWYGTLTDQNKVRIKRYLEKSDVSSGGSFLASVFKQALADENYKFIVAAYGSSDLVKPTLSERFDINEATLVACYNLEKYDACVQLCDLGLLMLKEKEVMDMLLARGNGVLPESIYCRNYKLNVIVGIRYDYDAGDALLDQYEKDGLISHEDVEYRKQSIKTFRLQRTFDNVFTFSKKN